MSTELVMLSNHLIPCYPSSPFAFNLSQHQVFFPISWLFISGGQSTWASVSASVLPKNIQGWFPLGLTGLISLLSKGCSRVFSQHCSSKTLILQHSTFLSSNSHIGTWPLEKPWRSEVMSLSRAQLFVIPWTVASQAPPSIGFSRQEYWSGLLFPSPGDPPDPGIEPGSPTLQADSLTSEPPGKSLGKS